MTRVPYWISIHKEGDFLGARGQAGPWRGERELPARVFHFGCQNMVRLAGFPTKYTMLVWELKAIPGVKDPQKLTCKIWASFSIPEERSRAFLGQDFIAPPTPKCLNRNAFLPDNLSYQDMWQQPFLLTVTYARGLQYWAEKLNLPEGMTSTPWWEVS